MFFTFWLFDFSITSIFFWLIDAFLDFYGL